VQGSLAGASVPRPKRGGNRPLVEVAIGGWRMHKLLSFYYQCGRESFSSSWAYANGFIGAVVGAAMTASGLSFINTGNAIANGVLTFLAYFLLAYLLAFIFGFFFISPFLAWKKERTAREDAEAQIEPIRLREIEIQEAHAEALKAQTRELAQQREQRERELNPALRAYRETVFQSVVSGNPIEDTSLYTVIYWIAARSSWGRWQAAQRHMELSGEPNNMLLSGALSYFWIN
jgi:hypothetical protein